MESYVYKQIEIEFNLTKDEIDTICGACELFNKMVDTVKNQDALSSKTKITIVDPYERTEVDWETIYNAQDVLQDFVG